MKKLLLIFIVLLSALPSFGQKTSNSKTKKAVKKTATNTTAKPAEPKADTKTIKFFKGEEPKFKVEMRSQSKPGFIFFSHEKSVEANTFEEKVLHDSNIVRYVDSNLLALRVNGPDYPYVVMGYGLESLPAVILFDRNGREIDRFYGMKSKSEFLAFLKQISQ